MAGSSVTPLLRVVTNPQSTQVKRLTVAFVPRRLYSLHSQCTEVSVEAVKGLHAVVSSVVASSIVAGQGKVKTGCFASPWLRCTVVLSILGTGVVSGPMSTSTARLTIGRALELSKTFLTLL